VSTQVNEPVRIVECVPEGSLVVFGNQYTVKASEKNSGTTDGAITSNAKKNTLVMKLRPHLLSWSGDSFTVVDVSKGNQELFRVGGKALTFNQRREVADAKTGKAIFHMQENFLQLDDYQTIYRQGKNGDAAEELFRVYSGFGNYQQWTEGLKNSNGVPFKLGGKMGIFLKGHIYLDRGQELDSRKAIARVMSPLDWCDFWPAGWERDSYLVEVAQGVDYALVLAMVLAVDKMMQTYDSD